MFKPKFALGQYFTLNGTEFVVIGVPDSPSSYYFVECPSKDNLYVLSESTLTATLQPTEKVDAVYAGHADFHWKKRNKSVKMLRDLKKHFKIK